MTVNVIIDSKVTGNFITPQFVKKAKIPTQEKKNLVQINTIDGKPFNGGMLGEETIAIPMNFEHHLEMVQFDVVKMVRYEAILGIPWLEKHNPDIDWVVQDMTFLDADVIGTQKDKQRC